MTTYKDAIGTELLGNVLLGKTPTFSGWNTDPSGDVDRLTDGSIATAMTSGSKTLGGAWQYAYIIFAVPNGVYLMGGYGNIVCATASGSIESYGDSGKQSYTGTVGEWAAYFGAAYVLVTGGSLRFGLTADAASTITPNIYELWATRVA